MPGNKAVKCWIYTTATGMLSHNDVYFLQLADKHYMLFFKKYKVSAEDVVVSKDVTINVPKGLTLFINDILVGDRI